MFRSLTAFALVATMSAVALPVNAQSNGHITADSQALKSAVRIMARLIRAQQQATYYCSISTLAHYSAMGGRVVDSDFAQSNVQCVNSKMLNFYKSMGISDLAINITP